MRNHIASDVALRIMEDAPAIDLHVHTLLWSYLFGFDPAKHHDRRHGIPFFQRWTDLPRTADGLTGVQFQSLASLPIFGERFAYRTVNRQIDCLDRLVEKHPELVVKARSLEDVAQARIDGKIAYLLGVEGAHGLGGKLENVEKLAKRGVRYLCLAHFSRNRACWPSVGFKANSYMGLTGFGRELISACEENGVIVDLAHMNQRGFFEVTYRATKPFIVSHTGVKGAFNHSRNLDDEQIRMVADSGGLIGVMFVAWVLGGPSIQMPSLHLDHIVNLVGDDHVAIGSDLDSPVKMSPQLSESSMMPNLVETLLWLEWSEERIAKLLRSNVLRLLQAVPPVHTE